MTDKGHEFTEEDYGREEEWEADWEEYYGVGYEEYRANPDLYDYIAEK